MGISNTKREKVIRRAGRCCEYCRIAETDDIPSFHVDHIVPIKHQGNDDLDNLAWACYHCNSYKGSNMAAADPLTGEATFLFNPRTQVWEEHFKVNQNGILTGITAEGRVTIEVMRINEEARVQYRQLAISIGEYPCQKEDD